MKGLRGGTVLLLLESCDWPEELPDGGWSSPAAAPPDASPLCSAAGVQPPSFSSLSSWVADKESIGAVRHRYIWNTRSTHNRNSDQSSIHSSFKALTMFKLLKDKRFYKLMLLEHSLNMRKSLDVYNHPLSFWNTLNAGMSCNYLHLHHMVVEAFEVQQEQLLWEGHQQVQHDGTFWRTGTQTSVK